MANAVYPKYKAACMNGGPATNLITGNVKVAMVHVASYTYDPSHEFLTDVPGGAVVASSGNLVSKVVTPGAAFQSGNTRLDGVSGVEVEALIIYVDTGTPSSSRLVAYLDTGITGLPVTPAGASYNIIVDPTGWFVL